MPAGINWIRVDVLDNLRLRCMDYGVLFVCSGKVHGGYLHNYKSWKVIAFNFFL